VNVKVTVDCGAVAFEWTDEEPGFGHLNLYSVHRTLKEAKEQALREAIPERDQWALCVRVIREATLDDVQ
jgi:hypothetical protein